MNWNVKGLLAIVILFFTACNERADIGLNLKDPSVDVRTFLVDTLTVEAEVILLDTVPTTVRDFVDNFSGAISTSHWLVGSINDNKFGYTKATAFASVNFFDSPTNPVRIGNANATYDSAVLFLSYDVLVGNNSKPQTFGVYELADRIIDSLDYYQFDSKPLLLNRKIGSTTLVPNQDSFRIMRIRVDALGNKIFAANETENLTAAKFPDFVKGIAVVSESSENDYILGMIPRSATFSSFRLAVYYKNPGDTVSRSYSFRIGNRFHQVESDFSQSSTLSELPTRKVIPVSELNHELYLQPAAGITSRLRIPYLGTFLRDRRAMVNRAELIIQPAEGSIAQLGRPPVLLSFYEVDGNGRPIFSERANQYFTLRDDRLANSPLVLPFNQGAANYPRAILTNFAQDVLQGRRTQPTLVLGSSVDAETTLIGIRGFGQQTLNKALFQGNRPGEPMKLKLLLYYTTY